MQTRCENGHYYDSSLGKCPYCANSISVDIPDIVSTPLNNDKKVKTKLADIPKSSHRKEENKIMDTKTIYIPNGDINNIDDKESVEDNIITLAGWLVVISDNNKGRSYNITFGFNTLGRTINNHIVLDFDNSISREKHASIIYDYANNRFFIKHEDGKYLTYLNDEVILETKELKAYDIIKIGNTKLLFVPLCNEQFKWDR